jgi:hypothetical protein
MEKRHIKQFDQMIYDAACCAITDGKHHATEIIGDDDYEVELIINGYDVKIIQADVYNWATEQVEELPYNYIKDWESEISQMVYERKNHDSFGYE